MLRVFAARVTAPALRRGIPSFAVRMNQQGADHGSSAMFADLDAERRRLLYRSKMRGAASWLGACCSPSQKPLALRGRLAGDGHHARQMGALSFIGTASVCVFYGLTPRVCVPTQAAANLQKMEGGRLEQFGEVLAMENPDLFKWMTGQSPVPDEVWATASGAMRPVLPSSVLAPARCRLKTMCCES